MGRRGNTWARKVKPFLARLKKSDLQDPPQTKLLDEAGRLCQGLQHSPLHLEKLVQAMAWVRHWGTLLTDIRVVQACVLVHLRKHQYDVACRLLESCRAMEKEELVRLWNEIHYQQMMETRRMSSLTAVQKFRCRKRHPPPASLCPRGVKSRNYPEEVRQTLKHFAKEVTTKPSRKQRERLAHETNLQPQHIYNWFANYRRRRQPPQSSQVEEPIIMLSAEGSAGQGASYNTQVAGGFPEDSELEQAAQTVSLVVGSPGWEQAAGGQGSLGSRAFLALPGSLQSDPLESFGPSVEPVSPCKITGPAVSCLWTGVKPRMSFNKTTVLETGWEPASGIPEVWTQNPVGSPCSAHSTQPSVDRLPVCRPAPEMVHKGVQCSLWSWDASWEGSSSVPKRSPTLLEGARMSPGVCVAARPETVSQQADLEIESLVLRERRRRSLGPCSALLGTPSCCPVAPIHSPEESQASAPFQVLWDSARDLSAPDTLWAAWLLCEFSSSSHT